MLRIDIAVSETTEACSRDVVNDECNVYWAYGTNAVLAHPGVQLEVRYNVSSVLPSYHAMLYKFMGPLNATDTSSNGARSPLTHTS